MFKLTHKIAAFALSHALHFVNNTNTRVLKTRFISRVAPVWNSLPEHCFYIENLSSLKRKVHSMSFECFNYYC